MEAIILAGGMGTRLQPVVNDVPKPMAPVNGKPFLEYLLHWLSGYDVTRIILSVGYKAQVIEAYLGETYKSIPLVYAEEQSPLGTGGAICNGLNYCHEENVLIVNGDTYFPIPADQFYQFHNNTNSLLTVAVKQMQDSDRYGSVTIENDQITKFHEKQFFIKGYINGGIYLINKKFIQQKELPLTFSFEKEILEKEITTTNVWAMVFENPFIDIGIPADYERAGAYL